MGSSSKVIDNLNAILDSIKSHPKYTPAVKLIAVSKKQPVSKMLEACQAGQLIFGENYVQEAKGKKILLPDNAMLHMIGPLQRNKAKYCPLIFHCIHSICNLDVAQELNKKCLQLNKTIDILIQMNLDNEQSKNGLKTEAELNIFVERLTQLKNVNLIGLMTIPNPHHTTAKIATTYHRLSDYNVNIAAKFSNHYKITELSMGMSADYKIALDAGSTFIRIGTAIFGERS